MALNLVRTDAWLNDSPTHDRWISRLSRLKPSAAPAAGRIRQQSLPRINLRDRPHPIDASAAAPAVLGSAAARR